MHLSGKNRTFGLVVVGFVFAYAADHVIDGFGWRWYVSVPLTIFAYILPPVVIWVIGFREQRSRDQIIEKAGDAAVYGFIFLIFGSLVAAALTGLLAHIVARTMLG